MGCGATFVKYVLFFFNLFFALAGLTLLGLGIAVQLQVTEITNLIDSRYEIAPILSIVVGSIIFVIAFYGCCGAIRESNCMLVLYAVFLIILIIVQVVLASLIFMNLSEANAAVTQWLNEAFSNTSAESTAAYNSLQSALRCCGTTGPLSYPVTQQLSLPQSCCESGVTGACTTINAFQTGCIAVVSDFISTFGGALAWVTIVIAAVEVVGVIFSLCLANHARNKDRRSRY